MYVSKCVTHSFSFRKILQGLIAFSAFLWMEGFYFCFCFLTHTSFQKLFCFHDFSSFAFCLSSSQTGLKNLQPLGRCVTCYGLIPRKTTAAKRPWSTIPTTPSEGVLIFTGMLSLRVAQSGKERVRSLIKLFLSTLALEFICVVLGTSVSFFE